MKKSKALLALMLAAAFVFVCGIGIAADKAEKDDGEKGGKARPKGEILYQAEFEEEDETDAWSSDNGEIEWQKGGANGSKGCLKCFNPSDGGILGAEKYIQWYDAKTVADFDYQVTGFNDEFYLLGRAEKAGANVVVQVKSWVKGKWAHAQVKASQMNRQGKSGKGDNFRNIVIVATGVDKEAKEASMLIDNVFLTATDKKKEAAE